MKEVEMETSPLSRLEALPVLHGHKAYVESLNTVIDCMSQLAEHEGAATGVSAKRMKNMLAAIAVHLRDADSCVLCRESGSGGLRRFENAFITAHRNYCGSAHAKSISSLGLVTILVASEDSADPADGLRLLPACLDLLRVRLGISAEQAA